VKSTYILTEGAILLAVFIILFLMSLNIPLLGTVATLFLPFPFIVFVMRHGYRKGLLLLSVSLLLSLVIGTILAVPFAFTFGMSGVVIGALLTRTPNRYIVLIGGAISFLIGIIIDYLISVIFFEFDIIKETLLVVEQALRSAATFMQTIGQQPNDDLMQRFQQGIKLIKYISPTFFVIAAFVLSYLTIVISVPILRRLKFQLGNWPPFRYFSFPKSLLWCYLLVILVTFLPLEEGSLLYIVMLNIYYLLQMMVAIQGFLLIYYVGYKKQIPKAIIVTFMIISIILPFLLYIIAILGIIDLGFGLRKHVKEQ